MVLRLNQANFISIEFEKSVLERFQSECGNEFVEISFELIEQYLKSKKLQSEFDLLHMREIGLFGIEVDFLAVSVNTWPYSSYKTLDTEVEPVVTSLCSSRLSYRSISFFTLLKSRTQTLASYQT